MYFFIIFLSGLLFVCFFIPLTAKSHAQKNKTKQQQKYTVWFAPRQFLQMEKSIFLLDLYNWLNAGTCEAMQSAWA